MPDEQRRPAQPALRLGQRAVRALGHALSSQAERARIERLRSALPQREYDVFGMHPDWVGLANALIDLPYRYYFRVRSYGAEHLPRRQAAILIANHSGTLPFDAAMLCADVPRHTEPPRLVRPIADRFVTRLPWLGAGMSRLGAVSGALANVRHLLEHQELLLIFPEGLSAVGKRYRERYHLQPFHVGFAELALRHRVPVIPVAIIGPEEQWPVLGHVRSLHPYGLPYVPIVSTLLPLPVRYHIHYGQPLILYGHDGEPVTQTAIDRACERSRAALQELIDRGRTARRSVFR